jgi:nucleoside-diphosphate-sugar epimerase
MHVSRKTALVTGCAGFVGRHISEHLFDAGYTVRGIDVAGTGVEAGDALRYFQESTESFDLVVHAAASGPHRKAIDTEPGHFPYNVQLDSAMLSWAMTTRPGRVVYLSSSAVYPALLQNRDGHTRILLETTQPLGSPSPPFDVYGWTKLLGELQVYALRSLHIPFTVVRPFSGYGEDQTEDFPFAAIVERARRREDPLRVQGNGRQVRDWIHIDDICRAIMELVRREVDGPVNLCTGMGTSIEELAAVAMQIAGYDSRVRRASTLDTPPGAGVQFRVGSPDLMHLYYHPRISLTQGIERRLAAPAPITKES